MSWGRKKRFPVSYLPGLGKHRGQSDIKNSDLYKRRKGSIFSKEFKIKESGNTLIRNVLNLQKENHRIPWRHIKGYLRMWRDVQHVYPDGRTGPWKHASIFPGNL